MFGYVAINKPEMKVREYNRYHAFYCGLCRTLKERYGLIGELTLTYDMTFLVILLNALYEPEETIDEERCIVHPAMKHPVIISRYSAYGADMNLLLMYYKKIDDWEDDKAPEALALKLLLEKSAGRLAKRYPDQAQVMQKELKFLRWMETQNIRDPEAAARSFGRLLGTVFVAEKDAFQKTMYRVGYYLGIYIYLVDAWQDREEDLQAGTYNPLPDPVPGENARFQRLLEETMARCVSYFERLPVVRDAEILRNILYAGVWTQSLTKKEKKGRHAARLNEISS